MKHYILSIVAAIFAMTLAGCSETVPPAHLGKVLSASGYSTATYASGRLWPVAPWNTVVFLDVSTNIKTVEYDVYMADKLRLTGNIAIRAGLRNDDPALTNSMFDVIKLDVKNYDTTLDFNRVWEIYAKNVASNEIRNVLSKATWDEISADYDKYGRLIQQRIVERLANTPVEIGDVNLGSITPPQAIATKYEEIETKIMDMAKEEAEFEVNELKKNNEMTLAIKQGAIDEQIAKNKAAANRLIADSISENLIRLRNVELLQAIGPTANTVVVPYESLGSPGLQNKMFR